MSDNSMRSEAVIQREVIAAREAAAAILGDMTGVESWKKIDGFDRYSVSSFGRVRNDKTGKHLKSFPRGYKNEYRGVDLYKDGRRCPNLVHRLVADAFLPPPGPGQDEVNHIDVDPTNNRVENLEWCTRAENEAHKQFMRMTDPFVGTGDDDKPIEDKTYEIPERDIYHNAVGL